MKKNEKILDKIRTIPTEIIEDQQLITLDKDSKQKSNKIEMLGYFLIESILYQQHEYENEYELDRSQNYP